MGNLEEVKPQVEETIPTPVAEEVKSTQIAETPTVRTYSQKEGLSSLFKSSPEEEVENLLLLTKKLVENKKSKD